MRNPGRNVSKVAELTDLQLRIDAEEIEATHTDSGGWGDKIAGKKQWEITPKNNLITTDTNGYGVLMNALLGDDTTLYFKILSEGTPTTNPVGWQELAEFWVVLTWPVSPQLRKLIGQ